MAQRSIPAFRSLDSPNVCGPSTTGIESGLPSTGETGQMKAIEGDPKSRKAVLAHGRSCSSRRQQKELPSPGERATGFQKAVVEIKQSGNTPD